MRLSFFTLNLFLLGFPLANAGKILMWISFGSKSHFEIWKPLAEALANRNHSITMVSPFSAPHLEANPHIKFIKTGQMIQDFVNPTDVFKGIFPWDFSKFISLSLENQDILIANDEIQAMLKQDQEYDVALISPASLDLGLYMAKELYNWPVIFLSPLLAPGMLDEAMGNPGNPAYIPNLIFEFSPSMTFWQRLKNSLAYVASNLFSSWLFQPAMNQKLQEVLHLDEKPDTAQLIRKADFALVNSDPIFEQVVPLNPNTAMIGGIHTRDPKPIDDPELKKFLDEATDGAIYISFGSILTASQMPEDVRENFISNLMKVKHRIVLKWETEVMENKPKHILLKKWLPQQDVLAHPNVRLFVTHGGLLSNEEAIYHRVPVVTMPGFADQYNNAAKAERLGYGKTVKWYLLNETNLFEAIESSVTDEHMRASVERLSDLFRDSSPVKSLDKAVFYTEYIMRHRGAPHLSSPAKDLSWYEYHLLDVIAFISLVTVLIIYILFKMAKFAFCLTRRLVLGTGGNKVKQN